MSGGTFRTQSGLRAVINAWLEDISFRTGMITGAVVLLVIASAGTAVAVLGHSGQAAGALGARGPAMIAPSGAASPVSTARPVMPGSATPARSAPATSAPPRSAAVSGPAGGSRSAAPATGSGPVAAASGAGREGDGLASPAGWRHGFPRGWDGRGWVWGPYRGGPRFGGPWW